MKASDAIKILVGYSEKELRSAISSSPDRGLNIEGINIHPMNEMPLAEKSLMRIGRHSWMIDWDGETGSAYKLTVNE